MNFIRIGTRKSKLALWQANYLRGKLSEIGINSELIEIDSFGDIDQETKLQNFSQIGVFTKTLDQKVLDGEIDLAIHSLKDYPTLPPVGIEIVSIGKRENPSDVLMKNNINRNINSSNFIIGTGSIRRKAQWKYKYPSSTFENLRGNVPTRIEKLYQSNWDGIIMAYSGLSRLNLINENCLELNWMIPSPCQGILGASYLRSNQTLNSILIQLQDNDVELCAKTERLFLNKLEGGCSAPIGALARISANVLYFKACIHDPEGIEAFYISETVEKSQALNYIPKWVEEILEKGGKRIMDKIKFQ